MDLDKHVEYVMNMLGYYHTHGAMKCKLFVLTLKGVAMTWFKKTLRLEYRLVE